MLFSIRIGGVVLDPFLGSGTALIAAHRTRRRGRGLELDPRYVELSIRRLQDEIGEPARHAVTGKTFQEMDEQRATEVAHPSSAGRPRPGRRV